MPHTGRCHCGAIRYQVNEEPKHVVVCHCNDCRRSSGAPMVTWAAFAEGDLVVTQGAPKTINSSGDAMRSFCSDCGSGLFYRNAVVLPGIVDIQTGTLDDPGALPPHIQIQTAERLAWVQNLESVPGFERFPE